MLKDLIVLICSLYKLWCFKPFGASVFGELWNQIEPPRLWASPHGAIPRDLPSAAADLKRLGRLWWLWRLWHIYPYLILFCFLVSQLYFNLSTLAYVTRCNKLQEESRHSMVHIFFDAPMSLCDLWQILMNSVGLWFSTLSNLYHLYQQPKACIKRADASTQLLPVADQHHHKISPGFENLVKYLTFYTYIYIYIHISVHIYIYPFIHIYIYIQLYSIIHT